MLLNPYLLFNGQCEAAFKFYEKLLGGKIEALLTHESAPPSSHIPPDWSKKIMHASLRINGQSLMGSDAPPNYYEQPKGFSVSLHFKDAKEGERVFNSLAENGQIKMPFQETFWALRFGMLVDRFGIPWMINCEKPA
ncbi:MAG TPA: VOC family protein [Candidatus Angelobacter sp.]